MNEIELDVSGFGKDRIRHEMNKIISEQTHDSIVRVRIQGDLTPGILPFLESSYLRSIVPNSINFEITVNRDTRQRFKDRLQLKIDEI
jgi:tRNA nucleotidyltransferase/poly(A) polymerase